MKIKSIFSFIAATMLLVSCNNNSSISSHSPNYVIIEEERVETNGKAQLIEYVALKEESYSEENLKKVMLEVYYKNKDKDVFEKFDAATVFGVKVFTSEKIYKDDKSAWIAMLTKTLTHAEPSLSFNKRKIKSLSGLKDETKSKDEIILEKINNYLQERNLDLCSLNNHLGKIELDCIHKADAKYPNYDYPQHTDLTDKLIKQEREKLIKKYNLNDSIFIYVGVFSMSYCK